MSSEVPVGDPRARRRATTSIKQSLREMGTQLSLLNRQVGMRLELKDIDLECFDLVQQHGPLGPTALARLARLHPATMTGVLDRLETNGWIVRDRDPVDRRAVLVRAVPERTRDVIGLYSGMNTSMDELCARYEDAELRLLSDFLSAVIHAGRSATETLATDAPAPG